MPNALTAAGLTIATQAELVAYLTAQFQAIYGSDINLSSDTPDGQLMNIIIQMCLDDEDLLQQVYNSFDPDNAVGVVLDQRVAINGIQRQVGTYTITPITIVASQSVNLYGLDQATFDSSGNQLTGQPVYTISDNAGNQWYLIESEVGLSAGTLVTNFRAATAGANLTIPNTITTQITIVLGVTSVNNPTAYTTLGTNEESDVALKVRRQQAISLSSQGYLAGILAALKNVSGVTSAFVYENVTGTTNGDGVPGHSIWVIVAGSGAPADIANAIYVKRNAGCGMFGAQSYTITQIDGSPFPILWDDVTPVNLFIAFTVTSINGTASPNIAAILTYLGANFIPGVYQEVNVNELATLVQIADPNTLVTNAGLGTGQTQTATLSGVAASGSFKVRYNGVLSASISWNDAIGTIQTKVRAITGLALANVTGSIASQTLTFDLSAVPDVLTNLTIANNTLATSGPVAITFSWNEHYANVLLPPSKKNQFVVATTNIVILPMQLNPSTAQVTHATTYQFTGLGGQVPLSYAITTNNSGGTINATTGLYTAGATPAVTDTITVTDLFGNTATATANVI